MPDSSPAPAAISLPDPHSTEGIQWLQWQHLTGKQIDAIDRDKAVVLVSSSPLEVHGPHLPTITDVCEAEGLMLAAVRKVAAERPDLIFLHLPPLWMAADVLPHVGSIMFRSSTVQRSLEDLGRSLCKQGFKRIWVSNFHGGPRHFVPIEVAADRVNKRYGGQMVSIFGMMLASLTGGATDLGTILGHLPGVTADDLAGDNHGGAIETAMMLHLLGEHVRREDFIDLAQRTVGIKMREQGHGPLQEGERPTLRELLRGFRYKIKYYEDETYSGQPALANAELGGQVIDVLSDYASKALLELLDGKRPLDQCRSPLFKVRWLFTIEAIGKAFERAVRYRSQVW